MLFTGTIWGKRFTGKEFPSHVELFRSLAPDADPAEVRCWILVKADRPYWLELSLGSCTIFNLVVGGDEAVLAEGQVSIQFRLKPCSSPNTSPTKQVEDTTSNEDTTGPITYDTTLSASTTIASALTFDTATGEDSKMSPSLALSQVNNKLDPFSQMEVNSLECALVLNFGDQGVIAVEKDLFENFVLQAEKDGKGFDELSLRHVEFEDGTSRDLALNWNMWTRQILSKSKLLRASYFGVITSEEARGKKLREIQQGDPQLWTRITYWVADFGEMEALKRLEMPCHESVPPYMSPFYFTKEEATKLAQLVGPSSASLGDALRAKSSMATCAAHDLKPLLETAFQLSQGFHKAQGFHEKKSAWIKKRQQQLDAAKRICIQKEAPPTFGGFGIR